MTKQHVHQDDKKSSATTGTKRESHREQRFAGNDASTSLAGLQKRVGNRAVQRMLAQRSGDGSFELDDETASQIDGERGRGHPLNSGVRQQMEDALGEDFSEVRVHTSSDADQLSHELEAKAFTTGQDVFFQRGEFNPHSTGGQELLAHELSHVVQQTSGSVKGAGRMRVNAPGDVHEQEAEAVAKRATGPGSEVQRRREEETEAVQMQTEEEEDEVLE